MGFQLPEFVGQCGIELANLAVGGLNGAVVPFEPVVIDQQPLIIVLKVRVEFGQASDLGLLSGKA